MWALLLLAVQAAVAQSADDLAVGREYYRLRCAECHGDAGEGGRGPNLADGVFFHGGGDDELVETIRNGIRGTEMPGFGTSEVRLRQVVRFLRSLNQGAQPSEVSGNAARGAALFRAKGDCLSCHRVGREGGFAGPDLTTVGARRSLGHLRTSILDPNADVRRRYWLTTFVPARGEPFQGYILNEDRYSVQILDLDGRLRSLDRSRLRAIDRERHSLMPSFDGTFDAKELEDLLAYLVSLRPRSAP